MNEVVYILSDQSVSFDHFAFRGPPVTLSRTGARWVIFFNAARDLIVRNDTMIIVELVINRRVSFIFLLRKGTPHIVQWLNMVQ